MAGLCDWLSVSSSPCDWLLGRAPEAGAALAAESPSCTLAPARACSSAINRQRQETRHTLAPVSTWREQHFYFALLSCITRDSTAASVKSISTVRYLQPLSANYRQDKTRSPHYVHIHSYLHTYRHNCQKPDS